MSNVRIYRKVLSVTPAPVGKGYDEQLECGHFAFSFKKESPKRRLCYLCMQQQQERAGAN
jgi:hypothetical protein